MLSTITRYPWKATLCITYACNLKCGFCSIWKRKPRNELTLEEWTEIIHKSPRFRWVDVTGGEPTGHKFFYEFLDVLIEKHRPWITHFPCNGSLPERLERVQEFSDRTRMVITISIDGPRELHDEMRGVDGSFDLCIESLRLLKSMRNVQVVAGMTVTSKNQDKIQETYEAISSKVSGFSFHDLHVNLAQISEHYYGNEDAGFEEATIQIPNSFRTWPPSALGASFLESRYRKLLPKFRSTRRSPLSCQSLKSTVFISPKGLVYPCITEQRVVGDLRKSEYDLKKILHDDEAEKLRQDISEGKCAHCWTPCEAYPTIIDHTLPEFARFGDKVKG